MKKTLRSFLGGILIAVLSTGCADSLGDAPYTIELSPEVEEYADSLFSATSLLNDLARCDLFTVVAEGGDVPVIASTTDIENRWAGTFYGDWIRIEIYVAELPSPIIVFMHELLHLLDFKHVEIENNIMNAVGAPSNVELTPPQLERLQSFCPPAS